MNLVKNRVAALGAAGALVAGSVLAGGVLSPAGAVDTNYTCQTSGPSFTFPVSVANPFPSSVPAGQEVGAQDVQMVVSIPAALLPTIQLLLTNAGLPATSLSGTVTNAAFKVGGQNVPVTGLAAPATPFPASGNMSLPFSGDTAAFTPSSTGTLPVGLPDSFNFLPMGQSSLAIPCELAGPAMTVGNLVVGSGGSTDKESTSTRAKFLNTPLTTAEKPLVNVRVVQEDGDPAAGVVVVKMGKKVLKKVTLNDAGKKRFRFGALPRGEHRLVFKYQGDADSAASKVVKTVRVRRA